MTMNIGIAGAGLLGRMLALALVQQGHQISLFDQDTTLGQQSCGWVAAGMLAPYAEIETIEPLIWQLGLLSLQRWPVLLNALDLPVYAPRQGSLVLAHPQDRAELQRFEQALQHKLGDITTWQVNDKQIQQLEPELNHLFQQGFFLS